MLTNRRGFFGAVAGLLAAPFAAKKAASYLEAGAKLDALGMPGYCGPASGAAIRAISFYPTGFSYMATPIDLPREFHERYIAPALEAARKHEIEYFEGMFNDLESLTGRLRTPQRRFDPARLPA